MRSSPVSYPARWSALFVAAVLMAIAPQLSASDLPSDHPRIFFTAGELPALRAKFNLPAFANYKKVLLDDAKEMMEYRGEDGKSDPGNAHKLAAQKRDQALDSLTWAYILTGDASYRDKVLEVARLETGPTGFQFDPKRYQEEFSMMRAVPIAIIYDALYHELSPDDLKLFRDYLQRSFPSFFGLDTRGGTWGGGPNGTFSMNFGSVFYSCSGIIALALQGEDPQADSVLAKSIKGLGSFQARSLVKHPDGAYPESPLYWEFAISWYLSFDYALQHATGDDHKLMDFDFFKNNVNFVSTLLGGDNLMFVLADTQPLTYGEAIGARLGALYDQPLMRWLADSIMRENTDPETRKERSGERAYFDAVAFLLRDNVPAPAQRPPLPQLSILKSVQWGVMRSDATPTPGLELAVKGHPGYSLNHNHPDWGTFILSVKGKPFIFQPGYYQPDFDARNPLIVKGSEPTDATVATLDGARNGDIGWMTVTIKPPKASAFVTRRNFVMVKDKAVVLLDDVPAGNATTYLQAGVKAALTPDKEAAMLTGPANNLSAQFFGPIQALTLQGPRDFGRAWVYARLAKEGKAVWETISGDYEATPDQPEVIVFNVLPADAASPPNATVQRGTGTITVSLPGGESVRFNQSSDKTWKFDGGM